MVGKCMCQIDFYVQNPGFANFDIPNCRYRYNDRHKTDFGNTRICRTNSAPCRQQQHRQRIRYRRVHLVPVTGCRIFLSKASAKR